MLLTEIYAPIAPHLDAVQARYEHLLRTRYPHLERLVEHVSRYRGKQLRPAIALLSGAACGGVRQEHVDIAVVAEMIHTATLVHDDILDGADTRRNDSTVNALWNNEVAVLLGDHLFATAFALASSLPSLDCARLFSEATSTVCQGEILQIFHRNNFDIPEGLYFDVIRMKTAALYAACGQVGATYAGGEPHEIEGFRLFGERIGIAFQIVDDVLDIVGDEGLVGKTLGTDLQGGKVTLPYIRLRDRLAGVERDRFVALARRGGEADAEMTAMMEKAGTVEEAMEEARSLCRSAEQAICFLPDGETLDCLRRVSDFVTGRLG